MTYLERLNLFNRWLESNNLPGNAQLLFFRLLNVFNRAGWPDQVQVDTRKLMVMADVDSKGAAYRARNRLVEAGWLEYARGKKGAPTAYRLFENGNKYFLSDFTTESATEFATEFATENATENATHIKTKTRDRDIYSSSEPARAASDGEPAPSAKPGRSRRVYGHDELPYKAAAYLSRRCCENVPWLKPADERQLQQWADSFRLLHERDGYDWQLINDVLIWSQQDPFWQQNIRSGRNFREKFTTLVARSHGGGRQ